MTDPGTGVVLLHDGGFEGFLTAVFEGYRLGLPVRDLEAASRHEPSLLDDARSVETDSVKAARVMEGVAARGGREVAGLVQAAFLSELPGIGGHLWGYLRRLFERPDERGRNLLDGSAHAVFQAAQRVRHEAHLFLGLVRFRRAPGGELFAVVAPDHDILAMLAGHFERRFPEGPWTIADARRGRCLVRRDGRTAMAACDPSLLPRDDDAVARLAAPDDAAAVALWRGFLAAVTIEERRNPRLQARLMPRKYWKYLPETAG